MFKRVLMMLALLALTSGLTGCYHQQVVVDSDYNASKSTPDFQTTYFHIIGLLGISNTVDIGQVCPGGAGLTENRTVFYIGLVTIEQMAVYCK